MNCSESRLLLHALIDGELDLVRSLDLEQHLKTCAACAAENKTLLSLRSALRSHNNWQHAATAIAEINFAKSYARWKRNPHCSACAGFGKGLLPVRPRWC